VIEKEEKKLERAKGFEKNALVSQSPSKQGVFRINTRLLVGRLFSQHEANYTQNEVFLSCSVMQAGSLASPN